MGMTKKDYLRKKGLLRPENDDILYIVHSTPKGVTLKECPVLIVSEEHNDWHGTGKARNYKYNSLDSIIDSIFMNVDSRKGYEHYPYNENDDGWQWSKYGYFDKEPAEQKLKEEKERINKTYINRKTLDGTIKKLSDIYQRLNKLKEYNHSFRNIMGTLNEYGVPDPLPALIHKLMYSCDNDLDEEIKFLKEVKNKPTYHAPRG